MIHRHILGRLRPLLLLALLGPLTVVSAANLTLAQLPKYDDLDLSADGNHLLMVRSGGEYYDLVVRNLSAGDERVLFEGSHENGLINWCRWANEERVVCSVRYYIPAPRLGQITQTRLFAINIDGSQNLRLVPKARNFQRRPVVWEAQVQDRVISWLSEDPQHILVQLNRDTQNRPSVFRLNIYTNRLSRVHRPRGMVRRWYSTYDGNIRLAIGYRDDSLPVVYAVDGRQLIEFNDPAYHSEIPPQPLGFTADEQDVFLSMTNGNDRHGIYRVELATGRVKEEIYRDADFDVFGGIIAHPVSGQPVGVSYLRHHPELVWFEPNLKELFARIEQLLPGEHLQLISSDRGYEKFVVYNYGGIAPRHFLVDLSQEQPLIDLGPDFDGLEDHEVVDLRPVQYQTRDGLAIPAYLAEPKTPGPHPTVLLPHGGPYSRDSAEFDHWTQFLVQHGYAVLKPNYRGSVGYGEVHMQAGYKQWGLKMQEDLMDGLAWLVEQGVADPERVCVVGASYGGYTALVSAYKFADQVRCAVSLAGISDLEEMVERMYNFDLAKRNRERVQDSAQLRENSPIRKVRDIQVPILMLHGTKDTVVRVKQSRRMAQALAVNNKAHRYVEQDGDHFLSTSSQLREFFSEMQGFLAEHAN